MSFNLEMGIPEANPLTPEEVAEAQARGILPRPKPMQVPQQGPVIPPPILPQTLEAAGNAPLAAPTRTPPGPVRQPLASSGKSPAVIPRVALAPTPGPSSPLTASLAARREALSRQLEELNKPADYSALQAQMAERQRVGRDDMFASVLAGIGPEAVRGMQEPLLKNALAARQPLKVEGGQIDELGQIMMDPAFQRNKLIDQARNRLQQLDALEQRAQTDAEKAALAHERNLMLGIAASIAASARQNKEDATTDFGVSLAGNRVSRTKGGNLIEHRPDGTNVPYTGQVIPKTDLSKEVKGVQEINANIARADDVIQRMEANPGMFGIKPGLISKIPIDIVQSHLMKRVLSPEQLRDRALIMRQAAQEVHDIYGAALTKGETARSLSWAINPGESEETTAAKIYAARDWAKQNLHKFSGASQSIAGQRAPGGAQSNPPQTPKTMSGAPPGWKIERE